MTVTRIPNLRGLRYIYIIECEGRHKVGIANEPGARLDVLQTGCPFKLTLVEVFPCPGKEAVALETKAHKILAPHSTLGEWFVADFATTRAAVVSAFDRLGVVVLSLDTLAHKLAKHYLRSFENSSPTRRTIAHARVGHMINAGLA